MAAKRRADVELRAQTRKYKQDLRRAKKDTRAFAKDTRKSLAGGFKGGFGAVATLGSAAGIADIGAEVMQFEEGLTRLGIQSKGVAKLESIRAAAKSLRDEFGVAETVSLSAAAELTNLLGGAAARADNMEVLTIAMVGTNAEMKDLAGLAQIMDQQFGLKGADDLRRGLDRMIGVGKEGSVPLAEMAKVGKQTAAVFTRIGADGAEGVGQLAAALQLGEQAFGTPAEAGTGIKAMVEGLESATIKVPGLRKQLGQVGTKSFVGLDEALERLATSKFFTDKKLFRKAFPSAPARTMITALVEGRKTFGKYTDSARDAEAQNMGYNDAQIIAAGNAGQMRIAFQKLRGEVAKLFTPERVQAMIKALEALGVSIGFVIDNWEWFAAAFLAVKALKIGASVHKWAMAYRALRIEAIAANAAAAAAGKPTALPQQGKSAATGLATKVAGGALAFGVGFEVGQAIENEFALQAKVQGAARATGLTGAFGAIAGTGRRQRRETSRLRGGTEAVQALIAAGSISETGEIDPALISSLRRSQATGRQLSMAEQAASTALASGLKTEAGDALVRSQETVFGGLLAARTGAMAAAPEQKAQEEQARAERDERIIAAIEALADRPVELRVEADVVARADQKAPVNRRSPAP